MNNATPPFHLTTSVWGSAYTKTFVEVTLPSLLSPGNIPSLPNVKQSVYKIFTTEADAGAIRGSASYRKLQDIANVELRTIAEFGQNQYVTSSSCYRIAAGEAASAGAVIVFLIPDMVFADGGMRTIARHIEGGKIAVLVGGLRTLKESIVPEVLRRFARDGTICAPPRELVSLAASHLHPIMQNHVYDGDCASFHPSFFCWPVKDEGFVVHNCHMHPVAINMAGSDVAFRTTIDDVLLQSGGANDDSLAIIDDSDDLLWFEMSSFEHSFGGLTAKRLWEIVVWLDASTSDQQRQFMRRQLKVHSGTCDSEAWKATEKRARIVVDTVLAARELDSARIQGFPNGYAPGGTHPLVPRFDMPYPLEKLSRPVRLAFVERLVHLDSRPQLEIFDRLLAFQRMKDILRILVRTIERRAREYLDKERKAQSSGIRSLAKRSLAGAIVMASGLRRAFARTFMRHP